MRTMTFEQVAGACSKEFKANTFMEIAEMSKKHGMEMFQKGDEAHIKKMNEMRELTKNPDVMETWFSDKRKEFDSLPDDK